MAHYAFLDHTNHVSEVITGKDEGEDGIDWEKEYQKIRGLRCKRTSYNTKGGVHGLDGVPFRKNYAGVGYFYDEIRDAFIPPKPHASWKLNEDTCLWEAPISLPEDVGTGTPPKEYAWDEITTSWVLRPST